jgi:hypothetical protein
MNQLPHTLTGALTMDEAIETLSEGVLDFIDLTNELDEATQKIVVVVEKLKEAKTLRQGIRRLLAKVTGVPENALNLRNATVGDMEANNDEKFAKDGQSNNDVESKGKEKVNVTHGLDNNEGLVMSDDGSGNAYPYDSVS